MNRSVFTSHGLVPSVYQAFKNFGWEALPTMDVKEAIAADSEAILLQVSDIYGEFSAKRLESMTHAEAPWIASRGDLPPEARCEEVISKDAIKAFFKETYGELEDGKETA